MTFKTIPVDVMDGKYAQQVQVVAEVVKIVRDTSYTLVALLDFDGTEIVALINGNTRPRQSDVGRVSVFKLAGKTTAKGVQYSGFYNPNDELPEIYREKHPRKSESSESKGKGASKSTLVGGQRSFALAYAKDCYIAGKVDVLGLKCLADQFSVWMDTGKWPEEQQEVQFEDEVPETTQKGYDGNTYSDSTNPYNPDEEVPF